MNNLPRIYTIGERVRNSELFPRIRDAEREMKKNDEDFLRRVAEEKHLKQKMKEYKQKMKFEAPVKKKGTNVVSPKQYFTGFVLDRDPKAKAYMPYDTVYFPKLFDDDCTNVPPESIDKLWMFGFKHLAIQNEMEKKKKMNR
jgi:hypothetical protein